MLILLILSRNSILCVNKKTHTKVAQLFKAKTTNWQLILHCLICVQKKSSNLYRIYHTAQSISLQRRCELSSGKGLICFSSIFPGAKTTHLSTHHFPSRNERTRTCPGKAPEEKKNTSHNQLIDWICQSLGPGPRENHISKHTQSKRESFQLVIVPFWGPYRQTSRRHRSAICRIYLSRRGDRTRTRKGLQPSGGGGCYREGPQMCRLMWLARLLSVVRWFTGGSSIFYCVYNFNIILDRSFCTMKKILNFNQWWYNLKLIFAIQHYNLPKIYLKPPIFF